MTTLFVNQVSFLALACQVLKCVQTQSKDRDFFTGVLVVSSLPLYLDGSCLQSKNTL